MMRERQTFLPEHQYTARQLHLLDLIGQEGACRNEEVKTDQRDPWFPDRGQRNAEAKAVCADCPVREPCLEFALETDQWGIWGGTSERERQRITTRRLREAS